MATQNRIWSTQDAQQLIALRKAAGLDVSVLAKRHSLSIHQVRQLEEGGDDRFYSSAIKWQAGRKLVRALGGDLVEAVREPSEETELVDMPSTSMPKPAHASEAVRNATQSANSHKPTVRWWIPLLGLSLVALAWLGWQQTVVDPNHEKKILVL
jgi:transposase-like protein